MMRVMAWRVRPLPAELIHHRNEIIQACRTQSRYKLTDVVVVVARQLADRLRVMYHTVGVQRVRIAIFSQCDFLHQ